MEARCVLLMVTFSCGLYLLALSQEHCDPRFEHQNSHCPEGYCCVRDEFLPSWAYCKIVTGINEGCTTRPTETNCPCHADLECKPNIVNADGTASLYGRCVNATHQIPETTTPYSHGHSGHDAGDPILG